ncbi:MAG: flagellar M-ring protein FliF, partial [Rhodobacteraceae bacterium]|nr:flagellar M-ring protein FliF [Paracoccaceae bacterium]
KLGHTGGAHLGCQIAEKVVGEHLLLDRREGGELARTITGGQSVRSARVHIAGVEGSPFSRNLRPTASVSVTTLNGTVSPQQAQAIRHLVAGAVSGLLPEDVAVVDARGMLISASGDQATPADDTADGMRQRVQRLLEARVGQGNAIVELSVDTVTERETIRERVIDPASRVAISTDTEETSGKENGSASGVTVASNLPDSGSAADGTSSSQNTQSRERVSYEISETQREISREPGSVRRLSVAVLVNGTQSVGANGTPQMEARSDEELAALKELVASAVGYDAARGDVITIKSMQFEPMAPLPENTVPGLLERFNFDGTALLKTGILAIVALVLGLFVLRPLFSNARPPLPAPPRLGVAPRQQPGMSAPLPGLTGEIDDGENDLSNLQAVNAQAPTAVSTTVRPNVSGALPTEAQLSRLK